MPLVSRATGINISSDLLRQDILGSFRVGTKDVLAFLAVATPEEAQPGEGGPENGESSRLRNSLPLPIPSDLARIGIVALQCIAVHYA